MLIVNIITTICIVATVTYIVQWIRKKPIVYIEFIYFLAAVIFGIYFFISASYISWFIDSFLPFMLLPNENIKFLPMSHLQIEYIWILFFCICIYNFLASRQTYFITFLPVVMIVISKFIECYITSNATSVYLLFLIIVFLYFHFKKHFRLLTDTVEPHKTKKLLLVGKCGMLILLGSGVLWMVLNIFSGTLTQSKIVL